MTTIECAWCGEWATEECEVCSAPLCDMCLCPEDDPDPEDE